MAQAFEDVFDQGLVYHGFTTYMRDYELVVECVADPRTGIPAEFRRLLFRHCVSATVTSALTPESWRRSLDERLISYEAGVDLAEGFVWGVCWQELYPGLTLNAESEAAASWEAALGIPFHEAVVHGNSQIITLVYSDLQVDPVRPGYRPYQVP